VCQLQQEPYLLLGCTSGAVRVAALVNASGDVVATRPARGLTLMPYTSKWQLCFSTLLVRMDDNSSSSNCADLQDWKRRTAEPAGSAVYWEAAAGKVACCACRRWSQPCFFRILQAALYPVQAWLTCSCLHPCFLWLLLQSHSVGLMQQGLSAHWQYTAAHLTSTC
jgi:hypothetical protein